MAVLRAATQADLSAIAAIYAEAVRSGTATFELTPPDEAELAARLAQVREAGLPWLVAEHDGRIAGYAYAAPFRPRPAYAWCVEDSVYLDPAFHRRGLGRALLDRLIADCSAAGKRQMVALIGDSANAASIGLHRAAGFRDAGRLDRVGYKLGRWLDVVMMQRVLGDGAETAPLQP